jgi:hypothetical protein
MAEPAALNPREVLIASLFGEASTLLDRIEAFTPEINAANDRLKASATEIIGGIERYRVQIAALTEAAQSSAVNHIVRRTNEVCEGSLTAHTDAMRVAAQDAMAAQTGPRIDALNAALESALQRSDARRWRDWLTHLATALVSSAITAAVVAAFLLK